MSYDFTAPIISSFVVFEYEIIEVGHSRLSSGALLACGPYGPLNHHPFKTTPDYIGSYSSKSQATNMNLFFGYYRVPDYASLNYGDDYAKVVLAHGCSNGEFRDQSIVTELSDNSWTNSKDFKEPNSKILSYSWPSIWWGSICLQLALHTLTILF